MVKEFMAPKTFGLALLSFLCRHLCVYSIGQVGFNPLWVWLVTFEITS